jgi:hypothetical protein
LCEKLEWKYKKEFYIWENMIKGRK